MRRDVSQDGKLKEKGDEKREEEKRKTRKKMSKKKHTQGRG